MRASLVPLIATFTLCVLSAPLAATGRAEAGWVIEQVAEGAADGGQQQVVLQANRMKILVRGADGKPNAAFIVDLDADRITLVNYEERNYVTGTVEEYAQMVGGAQQAMADAMKEMQEALKEAPPEQRRMIEQMMRSRPGQSSPSAQDCPERRVEVRKTGQSATIAGFPAVRYEVIVDGKLDSEIWTASRITAWRELDPRKLERFMTTMAKAGCRTPQRHGFVGAGSSWRLSSEGYPVRAVDRSGSAGTIEVVKAESRSVALTEFQPPPGFLRKTFREMQGE